MTRAVRLVICAVAALAVTSVGTDAYAGSVSLDGSHGHHRPVEHDGSARVLVALGRLDRQLARSIRNRLSPLTDADRAAIQANAASDKATVEAVAAAYSSTPTAGHLHRARGLLETYRPQRYVRATGILRRSGRTSAAIVRLRDRLVPGGSEAPYLNAAASLLAGVWARGFTARTDAHEMHAARDAVAEARILVNEVRADLVQR
jgi:hypothetical protein